jgi:hypothetical protein
MASPLAGNNSNSVANILKKWYKDGGMTISTYQNRPYWALITKKKDSSTVEGSTFQFAMRTGDVQSRNTVFSGAQSQAWGLTGNVSGAGSNALTNGVSGPQGVGAINTTQFSVNRSFNYAYATISTMLELQTRTNRGSFDPAVVEIIQSALDVLGNDQEISFLGGSLSAPGLSTAGTGFISQIGATTDVTSAANRNLVLSSASDVFKFSPGQELDLYYVNAGVFTKRNNSAAGTGLFVGPIDPNYGTLTIVDNTNTPVAINSTFVNAAVGDYICVINDFNYGALTGAQGYGKAAGFESWIPFGGPVSDTDANPFMGVNRNKFTNVVRVAGNWIDATGGIGVNAGTVLNIEDAILAGQVAVRNTSNGKEVDTWGMSHNQLLKLKKSNINRVTLDGGSLKTNVPSLSFKAIKIETDGGESTVMPSQWFSSNRIYGMYMPSWSYVHLGDPVEMYSQDGMDGLREPMLDAKGYRFFSFGNFVCDEPAANVCIQVIP